MTINSIEKMLESIKDDDIACFSASLPLLIKWVKTAIALRKENVKKRRAEKAEKDKARTEAI